MKFTVHTMEYAGGRAETSLDLRNYQDSDYEEYRTMYNGCFLAMRTALELQPAECCAGREELARRRSEIWILEISGTLAGSVAVYGNEIDDLVVKGEFQGRGLGRGLLQWALALLESEGGGRGRKGGGSSPAPPGGEHGSGQNQADHPRRHLARPL